MFRIRSVEPRTISPLKITKKIKPNAISKGVENAASKTVRHSHSILGDVIIGTLIYLGVKTLYNVSIDQKEENIACQKEIMNIEKVKKAVSPRKFCYYKDSVERIADRNEKALAWKNIANEVEKALKVLK